MSAAHLHAMSYVWIALGSGIGGAARYGLTGLATRLFGEQFPAGTLIVNVSGSLLLGVLAAVVPADGRLGFVPDARALLMIGLCGGFTTFSSFSLETFNLARNGEWLLASLYVGGSVALCLGCVGLGFAGAQLLVR